MMDVQIMRRIVDPVEAGSIPPVVAMAAQRWGAGSTEYFRSSANHIFRCAHDGKPCYLRLAHASERRQESTQAELDFILYVAGSGVASARPIPSSGGSLIEPLECDGEHYLAVMFEGLHGQQFEAEDLDEPLTRTWGRALARLHLASRTFPAHPLRPAWADEVRALLEGLPSGEHAVARALEAGLALLDRRAGQDHGLIHGDFELDNLVWDGEQFQVMDFDDASYAWYAADIAIAVQDVWATGDPARNALLDWFFEGYANVIPVPNGARDALPDLLNLLLATKIARLMRAYATTSGDDQPGWLLDMQSRHQSWLVAKKAMLR